VNTWKDGPRRLQHEREKKAAEEIRAPLTGTGPQPVSNVNTDNNPSQVSCWEGKQTGKSANKTLWGELWGSGSWGVLREKLSTRSPKSTVVGSSITFTSGSGESDNMGNYSCREGWGKVQQCGSPSSKNRVPTRGS